MDLTDRAKKRIPDSPGVYFFLGERREILYIGKATSLKQRVKSYFESDIAEKRSTLIEKMVKEARIVEWIVTDSVLEALLLEVNLIRTHKPRYNTIAKDDKSFNHVVITRENFPRVLVIRAKDLPQVCSREGVDAVFGPFPNGALFRDALAILRKLFKFYDLKKPMHKSTSALEQGKINFNRQIGLYPELQSKQEYARTIRHIKYFFEGKKKKIIEELNNLMMQYAKKEKFELAHTTKQKIHALLHIQDVALMKDEMRVYRDEHSLRIEAYDVAHTSGGDMVGVMVVVDKGEPKASEYRMFNIKSLKTSNDPAALKEILERRFTHKEWSLPQILVVDGSTAQKNVALRTIKKFNAHIPVVGVVKNDKHKPQRIIGPKVLIERHKPSILLANSEAHRFALAYHRKKRSARYFQ